jgi:urease accessory protein
MSAAPLDPDQPLSAEIDTARPAGAGAVAGLKPVRRTSGRLELRFATDGEGRSFLARQYASYPFHVCRALYLDPELQDMVSIYLQSSAGGIFSGDTFAVSIACEPGAKAHVTTQASTIAYRMPEGEACQLTELEVGADGLLEYMPDPLILFPQARVRNTLRLKLGDGATAIVADAFLSHDPAGTNGTFGFYGSETEIVDATGQRLVLDRFQTSGSICCAQDGGVTGGHGMHATVLAASTVVAPQALLLALRKGLKSTYPIYAGASLLPNNCGAWVRLLANDGADMKAMLIRLWMALRLDIAGHVAAPRHK